MMPAAGDTIRFGHAAVTTGRRFLLRSHGQRSGRADPAQKGPIGDFGNGDAKNMCLRDISVFISILVFSASLLSARGVKAVEPEPITPKEGAMPVKPTTPGPVTPQEGKAMAAQRKDMVLIDVRSPEEYAEVHYPGALNIPVNQLEARISEVPAGEPVMVYCARGVRAQHAYKILKEKRPDIKELYFIKGKTLFD